MKPSFRKPSAAPAVDHEPRQITPAERAERKQRQEADAIAAWNEHVEKQRKIDANTARLRALRLAREAEAAKAS